MENNQNVNLFWWFWSPHFLLHGRMFSCFHSWIKYPLRLSRLHHFHALNIAWKLMDIRALRRVHSVRCVVLLRMAEKYGTVIVTIFLDIWPVPAVSATCPPQKHTALPANVQRTFLKSFLVTLVVLARRRGQDTPEYKVCLSFFLVGICLDQLFFRQCYQEMVCDGLPQRQRRSAFCGGRAAEVELGSLEKQPLKERLIWSWSCLQPKFLWVWSCFWLWISNHMLLGTSWISFSSIWSSHGKPVV